MKKVLIIGGGFAGCAAAHQFELLGNWDVTLVEKSSFLGAGVKTNYYGGHPYTFGPRHFLTDFEEVYHYLNNICPLRKLNHRMLTYVERDNSFYNFPMHKDDIEKMPDKDLINSEIQNLDSSFIDAKNLEEYWLKSVGKTMYSKFVDKYNKKMWLVDSNKKLDTFEWSQKIEVTKQKSEDEGNIQVPRKSPIKEGPKEAYDDSISCYPYANNGYDDYFEFATKESKVLLSTQIQKFDTLNKSVMFNNKMETFDLIINTISPDTLFDNCFGELPFIGRDFHKIILPIKQCFPDNVFFLYYANDEKFTRIVEYNKFTLHDSDTTLLGLEIPSLNGKHYPIPIQSEQIKAKKYLDLLPDDVFSIGRAGSYDYNIDIDDCILQAMEIAKKI